MANTIGEQKQADTVNWMGEPYILTMTDGTQGKFRFSADARDALEWQHATCTRDSDAGKRLWHTLTEETRNRLAQMQTASNDEPSLPLGDDAA